MKTPFRISPNLFFTALFLTSPVYAVPADDVVCSQCVDTSDIATGAVTAGKLAPGAVTSGRIGVGAVTTTRIQAGAVTTGRIKANAVTSSRIKDGEVKTNDLANFAVTEAKIEQALQDKINAATAAVTPVFITVDCNANPDALRFTQFTKYSTYNIAGACTGPVYVNEDYVNLTGTNANTTDSIILPAGINGEAAVFANGANNLRITNLFIDATAALVGSGSAGIYSRHSFVRLIDSRVEGGDYGILAFRSGTVRLQGTNSITNFFNSGLSAGDNSNINTRGPTTVSSTLLDGNYMAALETFRNGVVDIRGGITISVPTTLTNTGTPNAIYSAGNSTVRIRNSGTINVGGNIGANRMGVVRIDGGTITGDINALTRSSVSISGVTITGEIDGNDSTIEITNANHTNTSSRALSIWFNGTLKAFNSTLGNTFVFAGSVGQIDDGTLAGAEVSHGSVISINNVSVTADYHTNDGSSSHIFGGTDLNGNNINLCGQTGTFIEASTISTIGNPATYTTDCKP